MIPKIGTLIQDAGWHQHSDQISGGTRRAALGLNNFRFSNSLERSALIDDRALTGYIHVFVRGSKKSTASASVASQSDPRPDRYQLMLRQVYGTAVTEGQVEHTVVLHGLPGIRALRKVGELYT